jgi:hypothetical protein
MNQTAWIEQGRQLYSTHANSQFVIGDWVNVGIATWGRTTAFDAAAEITGTNHVRTFFTRCAAVASYYKPPLRFPKLSFHTYEVLARFPVPFLEKFIPEIAQSGRSCAQLYSLAVEQYGSDPRRKKKMGKLHAVRLPEKLYQALAARAERSDKAHLLIARILEEWEQQQSAGKASVPDSPSVGNDSPATTTQPETSAEDERPDYATRRAQQFADGAQPIALKKRKQYSLHVQWTECRGASFQDTENGAVQFRVASRGEPTKFFSEADAIEAEEQHFKESGYHERVVLCPSCTLQASSSRGKKQVWHVKHQFSGQQHADVLQQHATV